MLIPCLRSTGLALLIAASTALGAQRLRVAYIPIIECAPLYIAQERGLFRDAGLDVELTPMKGGQQILPAVATGSLDIGFTNVVSLISFDSLLTPASDEWLVSLVGATYERDRFVNHALVTRPDRTITFADIGSGKARVGINTARNIEELILRQFLEKQHITDQQLNLVPIAFPDMLSSLAKGEVDVASVVEPFIEPALRQGKVRLLAHQYRELDRSSLLVATYAARSAWVRDHSRAAAAFQSAIDAATELIEKDPRAARRLLTDYAHVGVQDLDVIGMPAFGRRVTSGDLQVYVAAMLRWHFISRSPALADMALK